MMKSYCKRKPDKNFHIMLDPKIYDKVREHCKENNLQFRHYFTQLVSKDLGFHIDEKFMLIDRDEELNCIEKQLEELLQRKQELISMEE